MGEFIVNVLFLLDQLSHTRAPKTSKLEEYRETIKNQYKKAVVLYNNYKTQTGDSTFRTKLMPVQEWDDGWTKKDKWKEIQLRVLKVKEILDFLLKNLEIIPIKKRDYSSVSQIIRDNEINIKTLNRVSNLFKQMKDVKGNKKFIPAPVPAPTDEARGGRKIRKTKRKRRRKKRKTKKRRKKRKTKRKRRR